MQNTIIKKVSSHLLEFVKNIYGHLFILGVFFLPRFSFAQSGLTFDNPLTSIQTLPQFIDALLTIVIQIAIPVIVIFIIISGFMFVTAQGDTTKLQRARGAFVAVIIGAAIILGAKVLAHAIAGTIAQL
jgi:fumarate reductase subunit D